LLRRDYLKWVFIIIYSANIKVYYRYVDKNCNLILSLNRLAENVVDYLTKMDKNIYLTFEIQINNKYDFRIK
jgi:hypothetical protein